MARGHDIGAAETWLRLLAVSDPKIGVNRACHLKSEVLRNADNSQQKNSGMFIIPVDHFDYLVKALSLKLCFSGRFAPSSVMSEVAY